MAGFPEILKSLRLKNGLTQEKLANALHVSQNAIYNWENGKREPNIEMLQKISTFFGIDIDTLIGSPPHKVDPVVSVFGPFKTIADYKNATTFSSILAAHFDGDEYTEEELEEIKRFAEFVKSKRKEE